MKLDERIEAMCQIERLGGSVVRRDPQTLILYNCTSISIMQIDELLRQHPRCTAEVVACTTGFVVIFSEECTDEFIYSCDFFCMVLSCVAFIFNISVLI